MSVVVEQEIQVSVMYLVKRVHRWREATMDTEYFVVYDGREAQIVEDLSAVLPNIDTAILLQTFVVKPVHLGDLTALVITTDQCDTIRIPNLIYAYI